MTPERGAGPATVCLAFLLMSGVVWAQPVQFRDATETTGLHFVHHDAPPVPPLFPGHNTRFGVGAAVSDYDRDGDQDIYLADSFGWPNLLYRNDGAAGFVEVGAAAGVDSRAYSHMALFLDLDNDGFDDLVVINDNSSLTEQFPPSQIFRNRGDGTFVDVTEGSGFVLHDPTFGGATAGDYDKDGDLDLFVVGWYEFSTHLFRNDGGFHFTDVTDQAGARPPTPRFQWTPIFADFDNDGWQDIFCAVDFDEDYLLRNNRDGTFSDVSQAAGTVHRANDMGVAVFDLQDDGDLDILTTNVTGEEECDEEPGCNALYLNLGRGGFRDVAAEAGLADTDWGWGVWAFDAELDGDRDVLVVNGWTQPQWHTPADLFVNPGSGPFVETAGPAGIAHVGDSRSLVPLDLGADGDIDFLIFDVLEPLRVYENVSPRKGNHYLIVEAVGAASNRNGVGSRVYVRTGDRVQMQEITVGGSFYAGPPLEAHFGLGGVELADVAVVFPSGRVARRTGVAADQRLRIIEPAAGGGR